LTLAGCGDDGDDDEACTPETEEGCVPGLVCEEVLGQEPACFAPVHVEGRVFDSVTGDGVVGATVIAQDANGSARSAVSTSGIDGTYALPVPAKRTEDGTPTGETSITLRVDAAGYRPYPEPPRVAVPVDLALAVPGEDGDPLVVSTGATDVALLPREGGATGLEIVDGVVDAATPGGTLVLAVQGGVAVASAVADLDGSFRIFDVPHGPTTLEGYRQGFRVTPESLDVGEGGADGIVLETSTSGVVRVTGKVTFANAPGNASTSVILVPEATFDPVFIRGETPAGLRAAPVTGTFSIEGVPPGHYAVLAAFENDGLVRDPDLAIAGTDVVHVTIEAGDETFAIGDDFKVTEALAVVSPGAGGVEAITSATPELTWADDSSEKGYELRLYDGYGNLVFEDTELPEVTGSSTVTYTLDAVTLEPGLLYQFRVTSWRFDGGKTDTRTYISSTEDLEGAFFLTP
jgi:hypothetical protein